jgi:competence protein ComEC
MSFISIPIWKEAPFIRLTLPLITGILMEWHIGLPVWIYQLIISLCFTFIILFSFLSSFIRFKNYWISGILINILFLSTGGLITYYKDIRHSSNCITRMVKDDDTYIVTLTEPLTEKNNSFKATASVSQLVNNGTIKQATGKIIIYFQKDNLLQELTFNSRLAFSKRLQPVKNSGNPGAFNYQRYCAFQQIYYQVYLKPKDYFLLKVTSRHSLNEWMFTARKKVVLILQTFISGKKEAGLAEALLIGYKDDLDKSLVQSYSNTGVVHIIAISGLHVGLIYWLLNLLLRPLKIKGRMQWLKAILLISGLWLFSILTGGSPSVCRSAVMFSFIVMGENIGRKTNIYNSLAASAFLLLCYNPYWLWDAGFQLSYIAVLSIIIFMKPIYNLFYVKNKLLDHIWKMAAISIAAQTLTTPVSIYHFQQFPNYFLITNLIAVPLSSLIVLAELALCIVSFVPLLAIPCGNVTCWLIKMMNGFIDYINKMPFTITGELQLSLGQLVLIYLIIFSAGLWIFYKNKPALLYAMSFTCCFFVIKSYYSINASFSEKLIVYNIPHHQAIDLVKRSQCLFISDSLIFNNPSLQNFVLKPSRIKYRIKNTSELQLATNTIKEFIIGTKHLLIINGNISIQTIPATSLADIVILSGNSGITLSELQQICECKKIILDSSNSNWKINKWKAGCQKAGIEFYAVAENGAFILNLN